MTARHGDTQDYWRLPPGRDRARGHRAGCRFGGSGTGLRNLMPLHRAANTPTMITIENRIANQIRGSQVVHYEVTPVYRDPHSGILNLIHVEAHRNRGMDVDCHVIDSAAGEDPVCSSKTYGR